MGQKALEGYRLRSAVCRRRSAEGADLKPEARSQRTADRGLEARYLINCPPFTSIVSPMMNDAASEAWRRLMA
jgi:hypothetical protein